MRTTLDIADDVLFAARDLARQQKKSIGEVISDLARRSFALRSDVQDAASFDASVAEGAMKVSERLAVYGIQPLPARGGIVSNEMIDRIRDQEGI